MREILSTLNNIRDFSTWNDQSECSGFDLFCTSYILLDIDLGNFFQNLNYVICLSQLSELQLTLFLLSKALHRTCPYFICAARVYHTNFCVHAAKEDSLQFAAWLLIPVIFSDSLFSSYVPVLALIVKIAVLLCVCVWKLPSCSKFFKSGGSLLHSPEIQRLPWLETDFWLLNTCVLAHNEIFPFRGANTQAGHVAAYK